MTTRQDGVRNSTKTLPPQGTHASLETQATRRTYTQAYTQTPSHTHSPAEWRCKFIQYISEISSACNPPNIHPQWPCASLRKKGRRNGGVKKKGAPSKRAQSDPGSCQRRRQWSRQKFDIDSERKQSPAKVCCDTRDKRMGSS